MAQLRNTATADDWKKNADTFSAIAEKLKPHNMRIGYHNHVAEFTPMADGRLAEDIFFGAASPDVFIELDIGHCAHAGVDEAAAKAGADPGGGPAEIRGADSSVHIKDWVNDGSRGDIVGEGVVKWPEVLAACAAPASAVKYYLIEEESGRFPQLTGIERDLKNLKILMAGGTVTKEPPPSAGG